MITRCDICGKPFDTDVELGTVKDGITYCESCAIDAGLLSFTDEQDECNNSIVDLLSGEVSQLKETNLNKKLDDENNSAAFSGAKVKRPKFTKHSKTIENSATELTEVKLGGSNRLDSLKDVGKQASILGLNTLSMLQDFYFKNRKQGETLLDCLNRCIMQMKASTGDVTEREVDELLATEAVDNKQRIKDSIIEALEEANLDHTEALSIVDYTIQKFRERYPELRIEYDYNATSQVNLFDVFKPDGIVSIASVRVRDVELVDADNEFILKELDKQLSYQFMEEVAEHSKTAKDDIVESKSLKLTKQANEFLSKENNFIYTEKISRFEKFFDCGTSLMNSWSLDNYLTSNADIPYFEVEVSSGGYLGTIESLDIDETKIKEAKYEIVDGKLALSALVKLTARHVLLFYEDEYGVKTDDEREENFCGYCDVTMFIPENPEDDQAYNFEASKPDDFEIE